MNKYHFEYALGISGGLNEPGKVFAELADSSIKNLEIPGGWLDSSDFSDLLVSSPQFKIIGIRDILSPSITGSVADLHENIITGFLEQILLLQKQCKPITERFTLDIGLNASVQNPAQCTRRALLLKRMAPAIYRDGFIVNIPVRIPSVSKISAAQYAAVLRDSMCGQIKLALNIYPHETASAGEPIEFLKEYRFLMDTVSFVYEPEIGNVLVPELLEPWFNALKELGYAGPVIFRPRVSTAENLLHAAKTLPVFA